MADPFLLKILDKMQQDITEIKTDVKVFSDFRSRIIGGTIVISILVGGIMHFILAFIERN